MNRKSRIVAAAVVVGAGAAASIGQIEVILSEVPGHPTSQAVGALDQLGNPIVVQYKTMEDLAVSPDGSRWIVKTRTNGLSTEDSILVMGSGASGSMFAQEGQPIFGMTGERYSFFDGFPTVGFNSAGDFAFTARGTGATATAEKVLKFQGGVVTLVAQQGDPVSGLLDEFDLPDPDVILGNSLNHTVLLDSGDTAYLGQNLDNIHTSREPAILVNTTGMYAQSGVTFLDNLFEPWTDINTFDITPDGQTWLAIGDTGPFLSEVAHLAVNNAVVIREGDPVAAGEAIVDGIFFAKLVANGSWVARGDDPFNDDWAVMNGGLLAATFDPITTGAAELWGDAFLAITANRNGDWVLIGNTTSADVNADQVAVLNGTEVVVREGDIVDLNGNGLPDDDAFIGDGTPTSSAFLANDAFLTDDGWLYFFANLRDGAFNDLGDSFGGGGAALLRKRVFTAGCPCELDGDPAQVDVFDLLAYLSLWFAMDPAADIDGTPGVDVFDLLEFLSCWFPASAGSC